MEREMTYGQFATLMAAVLILFGLLGIIAHQAERHQKNCFEAYDRGFRLSGCEEVLK